ncbi:MAG TPA: hypothetical protein ENK80_01055 [Rhodobacterales bacterium]|nr:hypothetical protein [Rhodobacterales bacterium]
MFSWLSRLLFGLRSPDLPKERKAQNECINKNIQTWQAKWHDLYDIDSNLIADGEFERPDPLPDDIHSDFRLIFGLSRAAQETRQKCFELFPAGSEMHRRFHEFLSSKPTALSELEARARLIKIVALIELIGPNEDVDFSKVTVVDRETEQGLGKLTDTDDITVLLEGSLLAPIPKEELTMVTAQLFLTGPLYATAGNFYHLSNWVTAAMKGGLIDDLHSELYELWVGGWQVAVSPNGLILASRKV